VENKKIFLIVITLLLLVSLVLGVNYKTYDPVGKKAKIKDVGNPNENIAEITLLYNSDYCFINCEALISLKLNKKVEDPFNKFVTYNARTMEKKEIPYEILVRGESYEVDVDDFEKVCEEFEEENGTRLDCEMINNGTKSEIRWVWDPYVADEWKKGEYLIKIRAEKGLHDKIEWVPEFLDIRINEWATWSPAYQEGLVWFVNGSTLEEQTSPGEPNNLTNEGNGVVTFNTGGYNLTQFPKMMNFSGPTGSYTMLQALNQSPFSYNVSSHELNFTIMMWINHTIASGESQKLVSKTASGKKGWDLGITNAGNLQGANWGDGDLVIISSALIPLNEYYLVGITHNNTHDCLWINGTIDKCEADVGPAQPINVSDNFVIGSNRGIDAHYYGEIGQIAVWHRDLSPTELLDYYTYNLTRNMLLDNDRPNLSIQHPLQGITLTSKTFNISVITNDSDDIDYCFYNVTRGASTEVVDTNLSKLDFNATVIVSSDADYVAHVSCNDTLNSVNMTNSTFSVSTVVGPGPPGDPGGGGGGIISPPEEEGPVNICLPYIPVFDEKLSAFFEDLTFASFKELWTAFWNRGLCGAVASITAVNP